MVNQIGFITSLVMIGLFAIAIITFAIDFASENNAAISIADNGNFSGLQSDLDSNVDNFHDSANTSSESLMESTIGTQTGDTEGGTAFKVGPGNALQFAYLTIKSAFRQLFGSFSDSNPFLVILTAVLSILGIVSGLLIWKAWKGNP